VCWVPFNHIFWVINDPNIGRLGGRQYKRSTVTITKTMASLPEYLSFNCKCIDVSNSK